MKTIKSLCLAALLLLTAKAFAEDDWEVVEARVSQSFVHAVEQNDLEAFAQILEDNVGGWLLIDAYEKAIEIYEEDTLRKFEEFLAEKKIGWRDLSCLDSIVGEIEQPETLKRILSTGKISQYCLDDALDNQFQPSQVEKGKQRFVLAQILLDHGANWERGFWIALHGDVEGLEFLQKLPQFDMSLLKQAYLVSVYGLEYNKMYPVEEILAEPATYGAKEDSFVVTYCQTHGAVPTSDEILKLIRNDLFKPLEERISWWAMILPAVNDQEIALTSQERTHLAMDFLSVYSYLGFFNKILYPYCVPVFLEKISTQNLDPRIIAERIFSDSLTQMIEEDLEGEDSFWGYSTLVERAYAFYQLLQDPVVQDLLMQLPYSEKQKMDGKTFCAILSDLGERVDRDLGGFPWFEDDEDESLFEIVNEIGKLYFK